MIEMERYWIVIIYERRRDSTMIDENEFGGVTFLTMMRRYQVVIIIEVSVS